MMVTFVSECEKKALKRTRRVLDAFANRIGNRTWQTIITEEGLKAVKKLLRQTASKNTAVSCHWIRSRSRSDFLWSVGRKDRFNSQGYVAVNYTEKDIIKSHNEEDWKFLPAIEAISVFAALLHDFGKTTVWFQNKLKGKSKTQSDPLRHEWISLLFLVAIVQDRSDEEWLSFFISDEIHKKISQLKIKYTDNPLANLPPLASMIAWLILSHHKLPSTENGYQSKSVNKQQLFSVISSSWGYTGKEIIEFNQWFKYSELPSLSVEWQRDIKQYAIKLKSLKPMLESMFNSSACRPALTYARMCLMLGDHYYSSQPKDKNWYSSVNLFANTDNKHQLKQQLDEHLVGVARHTKENIKKLPYFEAIFNTDIRVKNNPILSKKSPKKYQWQDNAASNIKKWKRDQKDLDPYQFGFFAINMASTGMGKTFANAKIMQALSVNEDNLRYILALGLRTLTLQTGDEYREKIKLQDDELAVLIGSRAITELHKQNGSESGDSLLDNELIFKGEFPEQGLDTVLTNIKDRQFLYAPVLACTIDHIIQATEVKRGGRYILPTMRLMSSDLVIDEVDDFDNTDLIAIGRLIHLAAMLGRKVMISSATIPPDLAEGFYNVYQHGWEIFATMRAKKLSTACAWIDEYRTWVKNINTREDFKKEHNKYINKRIDNLKKETVKRKVNIALCSKEAEDYFENIKQAVIEKHQHNYITDPETGKKISIGVVRMANITPCIEFTHYLLRHNITEDTDIKAMAYHSQQVLLMRHEQEKYLDSILKRDNGEHHIFDNNVIRDHIDSSKSRNIIFVLVATPVEEVGRDHDFDWAVIEPSSYRSFIQMAGRVLRHRDKTITEPNIAIMQYNYKALKTKGKKIAFKWPGYQQDMNDLSTYNLEHLVNTKELSEKLDATNRIKKTDSSELATLEHKVIHELLTNYSQKGAAGMQGWLDSDYWLTALAQQYVSFRDRQSLDMTVFLSTEGTFWEKGKRENQVEISKDSIKWDYLDDAMLSNLWLKRDYMSLIKEQANSLGIEAEAATMIYGELNLPTFGQALKPNQFIYNDQLGLFSNGK